MQQSHQFQTLYTDLTMSDPQYLKAIPFWRGGKEVTSRSTFPVISSVDHETIYQCSSASESDVSAAIEDGYRAFQTWSVWKPHEKRDVFLRAAEIFGQRKDELFQYVHRETGETSTFFQFEWEMLQQMCKDVAGLIQTIRGTQPTVTTQGQSALVLREPHGVVVGISPWNAPYLLGIRACLMPLATGNSVILKGPEAAPKTVWAIADVLYKAGLPAGCLNTLYHRPSDAERITTALIAHPLVQKVNFTGSTAVGSVIASTAGRFLKPVLLELGGKASAIICEDADLEAAALECALGCFLNSGQVCMATERILVHENVMPRFFELLQAAVRRVFPEQPFQLINEAAVLKNEKLVQDAIAKGAIAKGAEPLSEHAVATAGATTMNAVFLKNIDPSMDIYHSESFGPSASIIVVNSDDAAIEIANDTDYGLTAAVFTEDLRRGLSIAKRIQAGAVHINSMTIHDETALPHGGMKRSGFGRFNSSEGLQEWLRTKSVTWRD
ncbi:Aldehyde/histidinol dehydrogenase [Aspergillus insuetus]